VSIARLIALVHTNLSLSCGEKKRQNARVKYWESIADKLSKAGWSWGCVSAVDSNGRIHIGPVSGVVEVNERTNVAGVGIAPHATSDLTAAGTAVSVALVRRADTRPLTASDGGLARETYVTDSG
jgi:hypothetical protein